MVRSFFLIILFSLINFISFAQDESLEKITLVIHGGAGTMEKGSMPAELKHIYENKLQEALLEGYKILEKGGTSTEAVIASIKILEDSPLFNAGKGAVFTNAGTNELDASIMDGKNHQAGAVAGVTTIKNPIMAAWEVMVNSPHILMAGKGAEKFATERGLEIVDPSYFKDERRSRQLKLFQEQETKKDGQGNLDSPKFQKNETYAEDEKYGTVGAVALDKFGNITAGTSTGGMSNKKWGRIGDSPIIGAGTYADNETCGVSGTGHGEYFIRNIVAYDISALMKYKGLSLQEAADEVINKKLAESGGDGGIVAVDNHGNISMTFNTSGMYRGFIKYKKDPEVFIFEN
ncbi:isoaspartyl peptidase/L-asparaginase [soil metagenome]